MSLLFAAPAVADPSVVDDSRLSRRIADTTQQLAEGLVAELAEAGAALGNLFAPDAGPTAAEFAVAAGSLALVVAVTVAAYFLLRALARPAFGACETWARKPARSHALQLARRSAAVGTGFVIDLLVVVLAWVVGGAVALLVVGETGALERTHSLFLSAFLMVEVFKAVIRLIFATRYDALRLLPVSGEDAAYWNAWLAHLSGFIGYGLLVVAPAVEDLLAPILGRVVGVLVVALALIYAFKVVLQNRGRVRAQIQARAERASTAFSRAVLSSLAASWHVLALAYLVGLAAKTVVRPDQALPFMVAATVQSLVAIGLGLLLSLLLTRLIERGIHVPADARGRFPDLEERLNAFIPAGLKVIRLAIAIVVAGFLIDAWIPVNLTAWLGSEAGLRLLATVVTVSFIILAATLVWILFASWVEHRLSPAVGIAGARERTLLRIFRNAVATALVVVTLMITLSELGVNIGPLLASAGVLGLAIGLGAQKFVQDVISGVFIQFENAINEGDWITAGGISGTVETLTIRSMGVRDLHGTYHIIPFSAVDIVSNFTRDFGYHVGVYGIAYREDPDEAILQLQAAFQELSADPEYGPFIIGELEVSGITALASSSVDIRVRIRTQAGKNWMIGRAYNRLVKRHFDAAGIEIPFPHQTIYFGENKDGSAPAAHVRLAKEPGSSDTTREPRPDEPRQVSPGDETGEPGNRGSRSE